MIPNSDELAKRHPLRARTRITLATLKSAIRESRNGPAKDGRPSERPRPTIILDTELPGLALHVAPSAHSGATRTARTEKIPRPASAGARLGLSWARSAS